MAFDEKLTGRLSIRDGSDHLIAEINKTARSLELGLEPGLYRVNLQEGDMLFRAEFSLDDGQRILVTRGDFRAITADPARRRGGEEQVSPSGWKRGYLAVEYSFSEFHPITVGLKLGVEKFYANIFAAFNPAEVGRQEGFAAGLGVGSILSFNKFFFFNPELNALVNVYRETSPLSFYGLFASLTPYFGLNLGNFSITAGPSLTYVHNYNSLEYSLIGSDDFDGNTGRIPMPKPVFSLYGYDIDGRNSLVIGAKAALRLRF
jgi:hypothetical protein